MWMRIPPGYMGDCARCDKAPATQQVEQQLLRPIPAKPEFDLPEIWTIKIYVCQACLEPDDVLTEDEPATGIRTRLKCPECGREFDLLDEQDAAEWAYGHDCEVGRKGGVTP